MENNWFVELILDILLITCGALVTYIQYLKAKIKKMEENKK